LKKYKCNVNGTSFFVLENHPFPRKAGYEAVVLYPYIFLSGSVDEAFKNSVLSHELVHIMQQKDTPLLLFLLKYVASSLKNLLKYRNVAQAYLHNRFEVEAYAKAKEFTKFAEEVVEQCKKQSSPG